MYCKKCNKTIENNDSFCKHCGNSTKTETNINNNQPPIQYQQVQNQQTFASNQSNQTHVLPNTNQQKKSNNAGIVIGIVTVVLIIMGMLIASPFYIGYKVFKFAESEIKEQRVKVEKIEKNNRRNINEAFKDIKKGNKEIVKSEGTKQEDFQIKELTFSLPENFEETSSYNLKHLSELKFSNDSFYLEFKQKDNSDGEINTIKAAKEYIKSHIDLKEELVITNVRNKIINKHEWLCYKIVNKDYSAKHYSSCLTKYNDNLYEFHSNFTVYGSYDNETLEIAKNNEIVEDVISSLEFK